MTISPRILENYRHLNDGQKNVIGCLDGPLRVIAGPGSGKTYCIILRALNLLLQGKAVPKEIILCTFTEKAAYEMRDRLAEAARKIDYKEDLSDFTVSTIHGFCNRLLMRHRRRTRLGHNYETLDELTGQLFLFEHFNAIAGEPGDGGYFGKWQRKWGSIANLRKLFDKIADEMVTAKQMRAQNDEFLCALADAYENYRGLLIENNRVDFAHLQLFAHGLLDDAAILDEVTRDIRYVLVDEYQDTNHVQEQILLKLTKKSGNLCVVGDEDQSIYRFRGATVRNILEFGERTHNCKTMQLTANYRSHRGIIEKYDRWMASANWRNPGGAPFRHDKQIVPASVEHRAYPAVFSVWGSGKKDEAARLADLVATLKENGVISDYSQVALLLRSVREEYSGHYIAALAEKNIPAYCPRAKKYFENREVRDMLACFALLSGWLDGRRGQLHGNTQKLAEYVDDALINLASRFPTDSPLCKKLRELTDMFDGLREGESTDDPPSGYFYQLLALQPFAGALEEPNKARNIAVFSRLINEFQAYYHFPVISHRNRDHLRMALFNSFFRFLMFDGGINDYEDADNPIPAGHVQIMTIHQSKGLEFPVVIAGTLKSAPRVTKWLDRALAPCYHRPPFEPENRITEFDHMRLFYVAFSRAQNVLVLSGAEQPHKHFRAIWDGLPQWPHIEKETLLREKFHSRAHTPLKKTYSFTGDIRIYETCPRQYQFYKDYAFTPARSAVLFFGSLVHQCIEEIHHIAMEGNIGTLDKEKIDGIFDRTYASLRMTDRRPLADAPKNAARRQVQDYFRLNRSEMQNIIETEVDVSLEKDGYILAGAVDLIRDDNGKLELLDFKTSTRPRNDPAAVAAYERQLCTYAHILEKRYDRRPDRLTLYWTGEARKQDALMTLPYDPKKFDEAGRHFDTIVARIERREFRVKNPPGSDICNACDMRHLCRADGTIRPLRGRRKLNPT